MDTSFSRRKDSDSKKTTSPGHASFRRAPPSYAWGAVRINFAAGIMLAVSVAACGLPPASRSTGQVISCVNTTAPHHAYVVVQHLSGATFQRCVGFAGATIDGQTLMDQSGVEYQAYKLSSGKSVCQVDNEPAHVTQCFPPNQPYWSLFLEIKGAWVGATAGFTDAILNDGDALGWHYVSASDKSPAPPPLAQPLAGATKN